MKASVGTFGFAEYKRRTGLLFPKIFRPRAPSRQVPIGADTPA
ncbi:MAG TPA: hypothetical protein VGL86_32695 [Polyangia bacterium]|jgi:hypothetical protein